MISIHRYRYNHRRETAYLYSSLKTYKIRIGRDISFLMPEQDILTFCQCIEYEWWLLIVIFVVYLLSDKMMRVEQVCIIRTIVIRVWYMINFTILFQVFKISFFWRVRDDDDYCVCLSNDIGIFLIISRCYSPTCKSSQWQVRSFHNWL